MTEEKARGPSAARVGPDEGAREEGAQPRGKWADNKEFLLSMTGGIIGFGNLWLFPYLCFRHGGVAFLIPYFVLLLFFGAPLFFLEIALGQYTSEGAVTAWRKICPMFEGVGMASQVAAFYLSTYFIVILAWNIFYMINSFKSPLPWSTCDNWWNTELCHSQLNMFANPHLFSPNTNWSFLNNITLSEDFESFPYFNVTDLSQRDSSSEDEFWRHRLLRMSDKLLGAVHWDLALCLLLAWVICYFCVWKGIKSIGKVVYFTATVPYLLLLILFFRGVTLPGAAQGLYYYLYPDFSTLADPNAWLSAGMCVMYSCATCHGVLTTLGSYNKYNRNCYRDCMALCCLICATSIFAGFIVFSVLGFLSEMQNVPLEEVVNAGPTLIFIAFPLALSRLPVPTFWTVLFFLTVLLLGVDTHFMFVESLATAITDMLPRHLRRPGAREILVLVIAVVCFLLGLVFVTEGGIIAFYVVDQYGVSEIIFFAISFFETIIIGWVYGADRFYDNIEDMIGYPPNPVIKYCWMFITPLLSVILLLFTLANSFSFSVYGYQLDSVGATISAILLATPLMCIPLFILVALWRNSKNMTSASSDLRQLRPHKPLLTLCKCVIFKAQGPPLRTAAERHEKIMMEEPSGV